MANSNMALTFYRKRYIFYSFSSVLSTFVPLPTISERGICRSWHQFVEQTAWRILDHDPDFSRWPIDSRSTLRFISRVESKHSLTGTGCVCVCVSHSAKLFRYLGNIYQQRYSPYIYFRSDYIRTQYLLYYVSLRNFFYIKRYFFSSSSSTFFFFSQKTRMKPSQPIEATKIRIFTSSLLRSSKISPIKRWNFETHTRYFNSYEYDSYVIEVVSRIRNTSVVPRDFQNKSEAKNVHVSFSFFKTYARRLRRDRFDEIFFHPDEIHFTIFQRQFILLLHSLRALELHSLVNPPRSTGSN